MANADAVKKRVFYFPKAAQVKGLRPKTFQFRKIKPLAEANANTNRKGVFYMFERDGD